MQGRIVSTAEVSRAGRTDREGAPASAGSANPANELTSITPQLVAIGLHFPYRASHTQGQRLDVQRWGLDSCPLSQQGNNLRSESAETITRHTYLRQRVFFIIWNCQKTSSSLRQTAALMDAGELESGFHHQT